MTTPSWNYTGNLNIVDRGHTSPLLPNGRSPGRGGIGAGSLAVPNYTIRLQDMELHRGLSVARYLCTATLLPDGRVLLQADILMIVRRFGITSTAELYDPSSGTWSQTGTSLVIAPGIRDRLRSGKILVAGGAGAANNIIANTADFGTGLQGPGRHRQTTTARYGQTATLLQDGHILTRRIG